MVGPSRGAAKRPQDHGRPSAGWNAFVHTQRGVGGRGENSQALALGPPGAIALALVARSSSRRFAGDFPACHRGRPTVTAVRASESTAAGAIVSDLGGPKPRLAITIRIGRQCEDQRCWATTSFAVRPAHASRRRPCRNARQAGKDLPEQVCRRARARLVRFRKSVREGPNKAEVRLAPHGIAALECETRRLVPRLGRFRVAKEAVTAPAWPV